MAFDHTGFISTFEYLEVKANTAADVMSRSMNLVLLEYGNLHHILNFTWKLLPQPRDLQYCQVILYVKGEVPSASSKTTVPVQVLILQDNILHRRREVLHLVVPQDLVPMLKLLHDAPGSAHIGRDRTVRQAKMKYFWPRMAEDAGDYVDDCHSCCSYGEVPAAVLRLTCGVPGGRWEERSPDILNGFTDTNKGNRFL